MLKMLLTICYKKFQFGHKVAGASHFSNKTMSENEREGENKDREKRKSKDMETLVTHRTKSHAGLSQ